MKKYIADNKKWLITFFVFVLLSDIVAIFVQFIKGDVLNDALSGSFDKFTHNVIFLLVFIAVEILCTYFSFRLENKFKNKSLQDVRKDIFSATINMNFKEFRKEGSDKFLSKFTVTIPELQYKYFGAMTMLFSLIAKIVTVSIALFFLDWRLAIVTLVLLTMPVYVPKLFQNKIQSYQNKFIESSNGFMATLNNMLDGTEVIKNFSVEQKFINKFLGVNDDLYKKSLDNENYGAFMRIVMACMSYFSYFAVIAFSGYLVYKKEFNAGQFFISVGMIDQLSYPIIALSGCLQSFISIKQLRDDTYKFISEQRDVSKSIDCFKDEIKCVNAGFRYDEETPKIFEKCNFTFEKNQKYLLTGVNGSGKTTFINCLLRYHDLTEGKMMVDGLDTSQVDSIFNVCTVLRQNVFMFTDTIRNNITLFQEHITDKQIIDVLKTLKLNKYASEEGLETVVGDGEVMLSGGEQRKIALARVLLANKDVVVLDEPLANLDQESKDIVVSCINEIKDKTIIIISHEWMDREISSIKQIYDMSQIESAGAN